MELDLFHLFDVNLNFWNIPFPSFHSVRQWAILLQLFPIPASFRDMRFLGKKIPSKIVVSEKNPFTSAVSNGSFGPVAWSPS